MNFETEMFGTLFYENLRPVDSTIYIYKNEKMEEKEEVLLFP